VASSTTNKALSILENRIGDKAMDAIAKAAQSGQSMSQLLETLPVQERNRIAKLLSNPQEWTAPVFGHSGPGGKVKIAPALANVKGASVNALTPDSKNQNALAN